VDFAFHRSISFSFGSASHCGAIDPPLAGAEVLQLAAREAELSFAIFFSFSRRFSQKFSQPPSPPLCLVAEAQEAAECADRLRAPDTLSQRNSSADHAPAASDPAHPRN
jgi:hypothetical protein